MLILTRRVGESVIIADNVSITVLRIKGNQVRLGVAAPRTVSVQREEISERIKSEFGGASIEAPEDSPDDTPSAAGIARR